MEDTMTQRIEKFLFRDLHHNVMIGTASDRYEGWIGQVYSKEKYKDRVSRRPKTVAGRSLTEGVLPVESVEEYFQHFSVLELDFTFYALLLDKDLRPTQTYHALETYRRYMTDEDRLILKVPQAIFAQKLRKGGKFEVNPDYVNPDLFTRHFYEPAVEILGNLIDGFIFEQEYQVKKERTPAAQYAEALDQFFAHIPQDERYHVEVRTESLLTTPYFSVLEKHGVGQVLSHWTWLSPLRKQFTKGFGKFLNAGKRCVIRLMTPLGTRYEEAYIKAHPFDKLVEGMMSPQMVEETAGLMISAVQQGIQANVIINNRAGGNAPLIAQKVAQKFSDLLSPSRVS
jgi:uncharacterized protein YecE (DUF72 family)